jgi:hypothetical protein
VKIADPASTWSRSSPCRVFFFFVVYNLGADPAIALAAALQDAHDSSLVFAAGPGNNARAFRSVHVTRLTADESFVRFDLARHLLAGLLLMRQPNPVEHEPCGLLADSQAAMNLPRRDTVLGVGNEPHCRQPLIQADGRILEDGSDLDGKLTARMMGSALPAEMLGEETHAGAAAGRALQDAIRPALCRQILEAVFGAGEVNDGFLKSRDLRVFHAFIISKSDGLRKSIIAPPRALLQ